MSDWMVWTVLAAALVGIEIFTGSFYLLMIGLGMAAAAIAAIAGLGTPAQFLLAALVGAAATFGLRRSRFHRSRRSGQTGDVNLNLDIGQAITVKEWEQHSDGVYRARADYRGAQWDVELREGEPARSGRFEVQEIRGSRLIVGTKEK